MKKKILALCMAVAVMAGTLTGCGTKKEESSGALTYWAEMDSSSTQTLSDYSEMLMYQEAQKNTGVSINFIHPVAGSTGQESFNTLLASKDLPDMIEYDWNKYPGGPDAAIKDGVIISLNDYIKKYAPNYYDYVLGKKNEENHNLYQASVMSSEKNIYGFNSLNIGNARGFAGITVRKDLLDKWGMSVPETIDDWDKVFEKAKQEGFSKPFTILGGMFSTVSGAHVFNTAYDIGANYYVEGDKIAFGPFQPGYKEYVAKIAEWVKKGYIDKNFVTNTMTDVEGNMTNGTSIASFGWIGSGMGKLIAAMEERDPNYALVACPYPVLKKGDVCRFQEVQAEGGQPTIAITTSCKDIVKALKFCDYFYSDEGSIIRTFGIEGDTYTVEDVDGEKHYVYTDKIKDFKTSGASSINETLYKYLRPANAPGLNQHPDYLDGYYQYQAQRDALKVWNANIEEARKTALPAMTYTDEEVSRKATLEQSCQSDFETAINEIIAGNTDISEYDNIINKAKADGFDEILEIMNAAYKRYLERLK